LVERAAAGEAPSSPQPPEAGPRGLVLPRSVRRGRQPEGEVGGWAWAKAHL